MKSDLKDGVVSEQGAGLRCAIYVYRVVVNVNN